MNVYLTVHCHFYQPPRENPWIEEIECQDSADPFHDWNERIADECYTPNGWARINDSQGRVLNIINNYRYISFNFGPTLMSWLEDKLPTTYQRILEADRESFTEHNGHGNAIAQVYNHIIMPLANQRDKITQVRWGLADFQHRFKRMPESIWLAETAVDYPTLEVLIDHKIKYLILSPTQAARCRSIGDSDWTDVSNGEIDPTRAYRCFLPDGSGRSIDIFFYDGPISRAIGFESLLHNSMKLVERFQEAVSPTRSHAQLISVATDGETYGHHKQQAEMALAYAAIEEAPKRNFILTNYGEFLELFPPTFEVEIKPVSAWSCSHGVGRWKEDCGCNAGGDGWHQQWRQPLRAALDWLRDKLIPLYEKEASEYLNDPWNARDEYISIILNRSSDSINDFFARHAKYELDKDERVRMILLLEMQRHAMLMYTSCAWFFSELSGLETVQVLRYAARAIQIAEEFADEDWESHFNELLALAPSNIAQYRNGAQVYRQLVKPSVVRLEQVASYYAISALFEDIPKLAWIFRFIADRLDYRVERMGQLTLAVGRIKLKSIITTETRDFGFALLHAGERDFFCAVRNYPSTIQYKHFKEEIFRHLGDFSLMEIIRKIDEHFGPQFFTFKDLFIEKRRDILNRLSDDLLKRFAQTYERIYEDNMRIMRALKADGLLIPTEYRIAAEYTLSWRLNKQVDQLVDIFNPDSYKEVMQIIKEADEYGYRLNTSQIANKLSIALTDKLLAITRFPNDNLTLQIFDEITRFLSLANHLHLQLQLRQAQNIYFTFLNEKFSLNSDGLKIKPGRDGSLWEKAAIDLGNLLSLSTDRFKFGETSISVAAD